MKRVVSHSLSRSLAMLLTVIGLVFASAVVTAKPPSLDQKYSEAYIRANLVAKKTTMQEVKAKFGEPTSRSRSQGNGWEVESWDYRRSDEKSEKQGVNLLGTVQKKAFAVARLFSGTKLGNGASDVGYKAMGANNQVYSRTSGAKELAGEDSRADEPGSGQITLIAISFENGVIKSFTY